MKYPFRHTKIVVRIIGVLGIAAGAAMFHFENSVLWDPTAPDLSMGKTIPYPFKGQFFFISQRELTRIHASYVVFYIAWGAFLILALIIGKMNGWPIRGQAPKERLSSEDFSANESPSKKNEHS